MGKTTRPDFRIETLTSKFPELRSKAAIEHLVSVAAAVEEVYSAAEKLRHILGSKEAGLEQEDYDAMLEMVTDLRDLFEHLSEHSNEASTALWALSDVINSKLESSASR